VMFYIIWFSLYPDYFTFLKYFIVLTDW
jgi:hypothetical protein